MRSGRVGGGGHIGHARWSAKANAKCLSGKILSRDKAKTALQLVSRFKVVDLQFREPRGGCQFSEMQFPSGKSCLHVFSINATEGQVIRGEESCDIQTAKILLTIPEDMH